MRSYVVYSSFLPVVLIRSRFKCSLCFNPLYKHFKIPAVDLHGSKCLLQCGISISIHIRNYTSKFITVILYLKNYTIRLPLLGLEAEPFITSSLFVYFDKDTFKINSGFNKVFRNMRWLRHKWYKICRSLTIVAMVFV